MYESRPILVSKAAEDIASDDALERLVLLAYISTAQNETNICDTVQHSTFRSSLRSPEATDDSTSTKTHSLDWFVIVCQFRESYVASGFPL